MKMVKPVEADCLIGLKDGSVAIFGADEGDPELIIFNEQV